MKSQTEKSRGRVAASARREELKRLKKSGTLLANELAPKMTMERRETCLETWASRPGTEAVLLLWRSFNTSGDERRNLWRQFAPPTWAPQEFPFPVGRDAYWVQFSPSGRWVAACEGWGDCRVLIWDVETGRQPTEHRLGDIGHSAGLSCQAPVISYSADESRLYMTSFRSAVILSLPTGTEAGAVQEIKFGSSDGCRILAPHPGGSWLALECGDRLGLLDLRRPAEFREVSLGGEWDAGGAMVRQLSKPEFLRKFAELKQRYPERQTYFDELLRMQKQIAAEARPQPHERLLALSFTPDGHWLICGTDEGVRVFNWATLIKAPAGPLQSDCVAAVAAAEEPDRQLDEFAARKIHCVGFDSLRQRVLFSGEEGKLKYLELGTARTGDLLAGPERTPITRFVLSDHRAIIAMTRVQGGSGNDRRARFQIWSYPALCAAAGLEF